MSTLKRWTGTEWEYVGPGADLGGSVTGYDQIQLNLTGLPDPGSTGSQAEWLVPLTLDRAATKQWTGVLEAVSVELTVPANATIAIVWISSEATRNCLFAGFKIRKVRAADGTIPANGIWASSFQAGGVITAGTPIDLDTFDTATADLDQGATAHQVKFKTAGTYRIYSEIDLDGLTP